MIEQLFGSKTRTKLLYLLFQNDNRSYYLREMAREINSQLNAVRREIANLVKIGLIEDVTSTEMEKQDFTTFAIGPRARYYRLKKNCLFYNELNSLLLKGRILKEREMTEAIQARGGNVKLLIITGVFTSDNRVGTDMLIVGELKPVIVSRIISNFEKKMGKEIRYTVMPYKEYCERKEIGDKFLYSILESKHLVVVDNIL
ncbi:MAG: hypothetical protein ABH832_03795 [bacterium]